MRESDGARQATPIRSIASGNRPFGPLKPQTAGVSLRLVEGEHIYGLQLVLAASFIALCVATVALLTAAT